MSNLVQRFLSWWQTRKLDQRPVPKEDPIAKSSLATVTAIFSLLLILTLVWALYDEVWGLRPWISYQRDFVESYREVLIDLKPTRGEEVQAIQALPGYQELRQAVEEAEREIEPELAEIETEERLVRLQLAAMTKTFTTERSRLQAAIYLLETAGDTQKEGLEEELEELREGPYLLRLVTSSVAMILEADHAILRLQDEETKRFVIRSFFGTADGLVQERLFKLDKQVCVETIRRRTSSRVADLAEHGAFEDFRGEFKSFLCAPLKRAGQVIGTLSVYDKVVTDRFYASAFDDDDLQIFTKFLIYVERAIDGALAQSHARQHRNFDEETGLPNASYLGKRIHEEIARSAGRDASLAVAVCRIENLDEIATRANPAHAHRVTLRTADALRSHLRDFDVLGRTAAAAFTVLLPEPGPTPGERIFELARAVADEISKEESLNDPIRVSLAFGYAVHPTDGCDRDALLETAAEPRIRMV